MAAIDKLYLKDYYDLYDLRLWATLYYPRLLIDFYPTAYDANAESFEKMRKKQAKTLKTWAVSYWKSISSDGSINAAIAWLMENKQMTEDEAREHATEIKQYVMASLESLIEDTKIPVTNTSFRVDRKLKWICPLHCIREYLQNQCGVKEHWYYKIFWKGRKHFW